MIIKRTKKVKITDIKIPDEYKAIVPGTTKIIRKTADYTCTGIIDKIYVTNDLTLWDGYCSYLILKALGYEKVKVVITGGKNEKGI